MSYLFLLLSFIKPQLWRGFFSDVSEMQRKVFIVDIIIIIIRLCLSYQDLQIHRKEIILLFPVINKNCITGIETGPFAWLFWRSWLKKKNGWIKSVGWEANHKGRSQRAASVAAYKRREQTALFMINQTNFPNWQNQQNISEVWWLKPREFIFASVIKQQV